MNQYIRKFAATTAIVALASVATPFSALAQDTAYVTDNTAIAVTETSAATQQLTGRIPLRSALNAVGVGVEWQQLSSGAQIVLTYGGSSLYVKVDKANAVLITGAGSYAYDNSNGSIYAGLDFYQSLFTNASVNANGAGGIAVAAVDANQTVALIATAVNESSASAESSSTNAGTYTYYESGDATWYGSGAQGNYTASGEIFNMYDYTAAHKYLPFGTVCRVTDTSSGRSVIVRINDRGPFGAGRVIDLSYQAASDLGIISKGVAPVTIEVLS